MRPGLYLFNKHNPTLQFQQVEKLRPSAVKAFIHLTDDGWWREIMARAHGAYGVVVDGERSDYPDMSNPEGDAEAGARELDLRPHAPRRIMGKNERLLSTDSAEHYRLWVDYHMRYKRRARELGFNVAVGALNTGHPGIALFGDPVDQWQWLDPLDQEMDDGDCWDLHEYWNAAGPLACFPWTAGRHLRCPTRHKILIGECGYDEAVFATCDNHGWQGRLSPEVYVDQLIQYHRLLTDPRLVGTNIFLLDFDNPRWAPWDLTPLVDQLVARYHELATDSRALVPVWLPLPVSYLRVTQTFAEHKANNKLGGWGIDLSCYTGTPVLSVAEGVVDRVEDQGSSGYGKWVQINHWWGFTRYAHLSSVHVAKGHPVEPKMQIGLSGSTGNSTGPHLHFEVIPFNNHVWSYRVDPAPLLGIGGAVEPPSEPVLPATITESEKAAARARIGDVAFLDKAATTLGFEWKGIEWQDGGYTYALVQEPNAMRFRVLKAPTGKWELTNVVEDTVEEDET